MVAAVQTSEEEPQASTSKQPQSNGGPPSAASAGGEGQAGQAGAKKSMKEMTKAERRAMQEQQRAAKAKEKEQGSTGQAKKGAQDGSAAAKKKDASAGGAGKSGSNSNAAATAGKSSNSSSSHAKGQSSTSQGATTSSHATAESALPGQHYAHLSGAQGAASPLSMFLHLDPPKSAKTLNAKIQRDQIHPSVQRLALQYADFKIVGANARCIAMLEAFKDVISSYTVPPGKSLTRHLPTHLSPQITHLVQARPMAISMGNAIRYLKWEISHVPPDMQDDDARELLCQRIDHFIRDRIILAGQVVEEFALSKIKDDDVILTYARSSLVEGVLLAAKAHGKRFSVVVVDSRPMHEGKNLLRSLMSADIPCTYVLLSSIGPILSTVSLTLLGAAAMLSNGAMYSRAGTATVAMMSKAAGIPVVCCCETYKFSDRIMLDSIVGNELASTVGLLTPTMEAEKQQNLGVLNFLYDVARPEDITAVITETAIVPVLSVPFVLREHKPINLGE